MWDTPIKLPQMPVLGIDVPVGADVAVAHMCAMELLRLRALTDRTPLPHNSGQKQDHQLNESAQCH